jgi:hypothetical protein
MIACSYFSATRPIAILLSGNGKVASHVRDEGMET